MSKACLNLSFKWYYNELEPTLFIMSLGMLVFRLTIVCLICVQLNLHIPIWEKTCHAIVEKCHHPHGTTSSYL